VLDCPHCGERTVSPIRKLFLGPAFEHRCPACRKHWGISRWSIVASAAGIAAYWVFLRVAQPSNLGASIGLVVAVAAVGLALVFLVPVVRK
jgi:hypothetical protein